MRMYLIGMRPQLSTEEAEALIKSVDFCGVCGGEPFSVGDVLDVPYVVNATNGGHPVVGDKLLVKAVEHGGRVAIVEPLKEERRWKSKR